MDVVDAVETDLTMKRPIQAAMAATQRSLLPLAAAILAAQCGHAQTANWIGGNAQRRWDLPENWSPAVVPFNGVGVSYTVLIPADSSATLLGGIQGAVGAFRLGERAWLDLIEDAQLEVIGTTLIRGRIQADGPATHFKALGSGVVLEANPSLSARAGAAIQIAASGLSWPRVDEDRVLFAAADPGSRVELSQLASLSLSPGNGARAYSIRAVDDGLVDLSGLGTIAGPGEDDELALIVTTGGTIALDQLQQVTGRVRFEVLSPGFEVPRLQSATDLQWNIGTNLPVTAPALQSLTRGGVRVADGGLWNAPQLLRLDSTTLQVDGTGSIVATNLAAFRNGDLQLQPGRDLQLGNLVDIFSSRISVTGGATFRVGAAAYDTYEDWRWSPTLFSVSGAGSRLDLSSLQTVTVPGGWGGSWNYGIVAENNGEIDLSGTTTVFGCRYDAYENNDWLEFHVRNGGILKLPNLRTLTRRTQWHLGVPFFSLPALETMDFAQFNVIAGGRLDLPVVRAAYGTGFAMGDGAAVEVPELTSLNLGSFGWGFNSTFNAPKLVQFYDSAVDITPGRNFNVPAFSDIFSSRISVSGGRTFRVSATSYDMWGDWRWSPTLFSASGAGSRLDLSSLQTLTAQGGWGGAFSYGVVAENNGEIDLSGTTTVVGCRYDAYDNDDWLAFHVRNGGILRFPNLRTLTRRTQWNLGVPFFSLPALETMDFAQFNVIAGGRLDLPVVRAAYGTGFAMGDGAAVEVPELTSLNLGSFGWGFNSTFNAPKLVQFYDSAVDITPGRNFNVPAFSDIFSSRISVSGGRTFRVSATSYDMWGDWRWSPTLFSASGAGSRLDLSSLQTLTAQGGWGGAFSYGVVAENNGEIDLSGTTGVVGCRVDAYDNDDWLSFDVRTGGWMKLGSPVISRRARISASGTGTRLQFGNFLIQSPAMLSVSGKATMTVGGDYGFNAVDPNAVVIEGAYFQMNGAVPQRLEVGGRDTGVGGPGTRNFGMSQLIVGETNRASVVRLVDAIDNGQRGGTASPEALYLYGEDGVGLRILGGSRLVLDGINAYAWLNGAMQRLAALIPEGSNSVRFGDGFLARRGGPRIIAQSLNTPVVPPLGALEVTFDMPLKPGSFGPEDVSITGPSGAISVTRVQALSETTYRIEFGPTTESGTYALRVGPGIDELAGNLSGMDQDGDGASGHPVGDVYVGSFVVDGQAPQVVGVFTVRGGTRVGIRFNEPVVGEQAGLASNYQVDGVAPLAVEVRAGGRDVVLQVAPITGSDFALRIQDVRDSLGNSGTITSTGTVLPWTQQDLGTPGVDPLEPGWALTFDGSSYEVAAGGSGFYYDRGLLLHESRVGDFDLRFRLSSLNHTGNYTHAGLMARESLDTGAPYLYVLAGYGWNQLGALQRPFPGAAWDWWPGGSSGVPVPYPNAWLRLRREGDLFRAYRSEDGLTWTEFSVVTRVLPRTLVVGLAVSSENNAPGASTVASLSALEDLTPGFVTWPQAQSVASGGTALLGATVRGLAPLQYQWYRDGAILPGATASILEIPAVTAEHVGDYRLMVSNAWGTNWSGSASLTVDGIGVGGGLEADVSPGPRGDGAVTIQDWVKTGLLIAGIEAPANSSHFQRADCAPAPCGDGRLSIADWTLAGLYAVSLVEPVPTACGPTTLLGGGSTGIAVRRAGLAGAGEGDRSIWMKLDPAGADGSLMLRIMATWSGGENAAGFSVAFDPARLRFISAEAGAGAGDAIFFANTRRQSDGRLGFAVSRDIGTVFGATTVELARVRFLATGNAAGSLFAFEDSPVPREVVDPGAAVLTTAFVGTSFGPASGPLMDLPRVETDGSLRLAFPAESGSRWVIEASVDLAHWSSTGEVQAGDGRVVHRVPMVPLDARYFRARQLP